MAVGSALQAAVGMGLALFVVPLLVLIDQRFVPGPLQVGAALLALGMLRRESAAVEWSGLSIAVVGLLIGTAIGVAALTQLSGPLLMKGFGASILVAVAASLAGRRLSPTPPALLAGGLLAGIMGGMSGIHGPWIALVLQDSSPSRLRAMLSGFFLVAYVAALVALAAAGLFGPVELSLGLALVPGAILGYSVGPLLSRRLDTRRLRIATLTISSVSAVGLLLR